MGLHDILVPYSGSLLIISGLILLAGWTLTSYLRLRHIPGPFLASLTDLVRFSWVFSDRAHEIHLAQHRKYKREDGKTGSDGGSGSGGRGSSSAELVRLGPNMISLADPREIPQVYGFSTRYQKSTFYRALGLYQRGKPVPILFSLRDGTHRAMKRPVAAAYSMSNLLAFEGFVDSTIRELFAQLDRRFVAASGGGDPRTTADLGEWLHYFAFDVIGEMTFSRRLGFLEKGEDAQGIIGSIWSMLSRQAAVSQMPWLDFLWEKNPISQRLASDSPGPFLDFTLERLKERQAVEKNGGANGSNVEERPKWNDNDFLSRFMKAAEDDDNLPPGAVIAWALSNVAAGSDSTAVTLRTIVYNLLKHPATLARLQKEIDDAFVDWPAAAAPSPSSSSSSDDDDDDGDDGESHAEVMSWTVGRNLPYLDACVKEAGRLHPPFNLPLERVVPPEGATISGQFIPGGTVVGMSPHVVHRDEEVFGEDVECWRPERWLCKDEERRRRMEGALMTFGAGHRVCIGKNISHLEVYKLIPSLFRNYRFELPENTTWTVANRWLFRQKGLHVTIRKRDVEKEGLLASVDG